MTGAADRCLHCDRDAQQVPLIPLEYRGARYRICAEHLPVLIHDPARLIGQLPGAEGLVPAEHKD